MTPDDLVEIHRIEQLKYRYLRYLDLKMWDELEAVFTPTATASYGGGAYTFDDRDAIMTFLRDSMSRTGMLTSHKVHHPEITLTGPSTATGTWALEDRVVETDFGITISGAAYYTDEYVKADGEWLISHTGYKRVFEELQPRSEDLSLTASWWATDGRSTIAT
jgi:hypothetical protein